MKLLLQSSLILLSFLAVGPAIAVDTIPLVFHTSHGKQMFQVEVARDKAEQEYGLMNRTQLAKDAGMLFVFAPPQPVVMWMKDTLISLDMIFIGPQKTVVKIARDAVPESEAEIPSDAIVAAVLEVPGGTAKRIGLKVDDKVDYVLP